MRLSEVKTNVCGEGQMRRVGCCRFSLCLFPLLTCFAATNRSRLEIIRCSNCRGSGVCQMNLHTRPGLSLKEFRSDGWARPNGRMRPGGLAFAFGSRFMGIVMIGRKKRLKMLPNGRKSTSENHSGK